MAHPDLDELLNELISMAQQFLSKNGEFFPFGATMSIDGTIHLHAAYDGDEQPLSDQLIALLVQGIRQKAADGKIRAAAICYDVRVIPPDQSTKTDAICVGAEHQNGEAADIFLPYEMAEPDQISYGEIFGAVREKEFFL